MKTAEMSDRELLELAAKAAGIRLHVWGTKGKENFANMDAGPHDGLWNPLTDDGDALRLAVTANLDVFQAMAYKEVQVVGALQRTIFEPWGEDKQAATRRAIVRAAAEIGKRKQAA